MNSLLNTIYRALNFNLHLRKCYLENGANEFFFGANEIQPCGANEISHFSNIGANAIRPFITYLVQIKAFLYDQYDRK
jgi:hypothetical protein